MIRKIIQINEDLCNGCGACAKACHEGAIAMVDGKAKLMRDDYCDGFGDCLPNCPTGAITFTEREAAAYDEAAVLKNKRRKEAMEKLERMGGCPGSRMVDMRVDEPARENFTPMMGMMGAADFTPVSQLKTWPVQIKLAAVNAPYFNGANLLIAADCTAYAYADFHHRFMKNRVTLIGCPKLDAVDYADKLCQIIKNNDVQSVTVVRMEVPCCGGMVNAVKKALLDSGKMIPWQIHTISIKGNLLEE